MTVHAERCPCGRLYLPLIGQRACHTIQVRLSNSTRPPRTREDRP